MSLTKRGELYGILEDAAKYGLLSDPMKFVDAMFNFFTTAQIEEFVQHLKDDELIASDDDDDDSEVDDDEDLLERRVQEDECYVSCEGCNSTLEYDVNGNPFCINCDISQK